jgi:hypothetical protein
VSGSSVTAAGWAQDPDALTQALTVHYYLDGAPQFAMLANGADPTSPGHGFTGSDAVGPGNHAMCAWAINVGVGTNTLLGCRTVAVG